MKGGEDVRMSVRSILGRPVESLLLIIGIALGIGATAAGVALAARTAAQSTELLSSTQYREIVVTAREESEDMDLPAEVQLSTDRIVLTTADLSARDDVPDVEFAYVSNPMGIRTGNIQFGGGQGGVAIAGGAGQGGRPQPDGQQARPQDVQQTAPQSGGQRAAPAGERQPQADDEAAPAGGAQSGQSEQPEAPQLNREQIARMQSEVQNRFAELQRLQERLKEKLDEL